MKLLEWARKEYNIAEVTKQHEAEMEPLAVMLENGEIDSFLNDLEYFCIQGNPIAWEVLDFITKRGEYTGGPDVAGDIYND